MRRTSYASSDINRKLQENLMRYQQAHVNHNQDRVEHYHNKLCHEFLNQLLSEKDYTNIALLLNQTYKSDVEHPFLSSFEAIIQRLMAKDTFGDDAGQQITEVTQEDCLRSLVTMPVSYEVQAVLYESIMMARFPWVKATEFLQLIEQVVARKDKIKETVWLLKRWALSTSGGEVSTTEDGIPCLQLDALSQDKLYLVMQKRLLQAHFNSHELGLKATKLRQQYSASIAALEFAEGGEKQRYQDEAEAYDAAAIRYQKEAAAEAAAFYELVAAGVNYNKAEALFQELIINGDLDNIQRLFRLQDEFANDNEALQNAIDNRVRGLRESLAKHFHEKADTQFLSQQVEKQIEKIPLEIEDLSDHRNSTLLLVIKLDYLVAYTSHVLTSSPSIESALQELETEAKKIGLMTLNIDAKAHIICQATDMAVRRQALNLAAQYTEDSLLKRKLERDFSDVLCYLPDQQSLDVIIDDARQLQTKGTGSDQHQNVYQFQDKSLAIFEDLIGRGADVSTADSTGNTALHYIIKWSLQPYLLELLPTQPDSTIINTSGESIYDLAVRYNNLDAISSLLTQLKDKTILARLDETGKNVLRNAIEAGHHLQVKELIVHGGVLHEYLDPEVPVDSCIERFSTVYESHAKMFSLQQLNSQGETLLHHLLNIGDLAKCQQQLARHDLTAEDLEIENKKEQTALVLAVTIALRLPEELWTEYLALIKKMIERGADVNAVNHDLDSVVHLAIKAKRVDILRDLCALSGINVKQNNTAYRTPFALLLFEDMQAPEVLGMLQILINAGVCITDSVLDSASTAQFKPVSTIYQWLVDFTIEPFLTIFEASKDFPQQLTALSIIYDETGRQFVPREEDTISKKETPLHWLVRQQDREDIVDRHISLAKTVNIGDTNDDTPLHCVVQSQARFAALPALIKRGAYLHYLNREEISPLQVLLAPGNNHEVASVQLEKAVRINSGLAIPNQDGDTLFLHVLRGEQFALLVKMLEAAARKHGEKAGEVLGLRTANADGFYPLHFLAYFTDRDNLESVLDKIVTLGVPIDTSTKDGDTLLHLAVQELNTELAMLLLLYDVSLLNRGQAVTQNTPAHCLVHLFNELSNTTAIGIDAIEEQRQKLHDTFFLMQKILPNTDTTLVNANDLTALQLALSSKGLNQEQKVKLLSETNDVLSVIHHPEYPNGKILSQFMGKDIVVRLLSKLNKDSQVSFDHDLMTECRDPAVITEFMRLGALDPKKTATLFIALLEDTQFTNEFMLSLFVYYLPHLQLAEPIDTQTGIMGMRKGAEKMLLLVRSKQSSDDSLIKRICQHRPKLLQTALDLGCHAHKVDIAAFNAYPGTQEMLASDDHQQFRAALNNPVMIEWLYLHKRINAFDQTIVLKLNALVDESNIDAMSAELNAALAFMGLKLQDPVKRDILLKSYQALALQKKQESVEASKAQLCSAVKLLRQTPGHLIDLTHIKGRLETYSAVVDEKIKCYKPEGKSSGSMFSAFRRRTVSHDQSGSQTKSP